MCFYHYLGVLCSIWEQFCMYVIKLATPCKLISDLYFSPINVITIDANITILLYLEHQL